MPDATHDTLEALPTHRCRFDDGTSFDYTTVVRLADALAVFAERERVLRERVEALRAGDAPSWYHVVPADRADCGWDYALGEVLALFEAERPEGRDAHRASGAHGGTSDKDAG